MNNKNSQNRSQKILVERFIDWDQIERRLGQYPAINEKFPLKLLRSQSDSRPFYCHFMAWRLGTWRDESVFIRWNELLEFAKNHFQDWDVKKLSNDHNFSVFWSLLWELQSAEYLSTYFKSVRHQSEGPDFFIEEGGRIINIECYTPRKSYGVLEFINELLRKLGADCKSYHTPYMEFALPNKDVDIDLELSALFEPFLNDDKLHELRVRAAAEHPVIVSQSSNRLLTIYLDGKPENYNPSILKKQVGNPDDYWKDALSKASKHKLDANELESRKKAGEVNIVLINQLLFPEAYLAELRRQELKFLEPLLESVLNVDNKPTIDGVLYGFIGIDEKISHQKMRLINFASDDNPFKKIFDELSERA